MVKRLRGKATRPNASGSGSDSDPEIRRPKKLSKAEKSKVKYTSTPYTGKIKTASLSSTSGFGRSVRKSRVSNVNDRSANADGSFENFTSFLNSNGLLSDDEGDSLLTVSQLAQITTAPVQRESQKRDPPVQKTLVYLNKSSGNSFIEFSHDQIRSLPVPFKCMELIALQHKSSLTLHGYLDVSVIVGSVSIVGYEVQEGNHARVFSSKQTGYKKLVTKGAVHLQTRDQLHEKINQIAETESPDCVREFLKNIGPATVVVLLEKKPIPPRLELLELYIPESLKMGVPELSFQNGSMCSTTNKGAILINEDAEKTAIQLVKLLGVTYARVIVHGPNQCGKSNMLRYLVNKTLNLKEFENRVFYLDADPGQSEYSPPGVVSLTKVTRPLLGPPFSHYIQPEKMIAIGSSTPKDIPHLYKNAINSLVAYFNEKERNAVLFVNTMGWTDEIGEVCFNDIKDAVKPTMVVDFVPASECSAYEGNQPDGSIHVKMPIQKYTSYGFTAKEKRNFSILSYLGRTQKDYSEVTYLNSVIPWVVNWGKIGVYVIGKDIPGNLLLEAINCSFVALCAVDEKLMHQTLEGWPKKTSAEAINNCVGFGFVRAVCEVKNELHIITPLPLERLVHVNAIYKGNVNIPDEVILKQPCYNVLLPYTRLSKRPLSYLHQSIKNRRFISKMTPKKG